MVTSLNEPSPDTTPDPASNTAPDASSEDAPDSTPGVSSVSTPDAGSGAGTQLSALAAARIAVGVLVDGGVQHVVVSPGSRSAPMAYALAEASAEGRVELLVRIDERSAGFTALGLAFRVHMGVAELSFFGSCDKLEAGRVSKGRRKVYETAVPA